MTTVYKVMWRTDHMDKDLPQQALMPVETTLWECHIWVLCCGLRLATRCVASEPSWAGLLGRSSLAIACDWPGSTDKC